MKKNLLGTFFQGVHDFLYYKKLKEDWGITVDISSEFYGEELYNVKDNEEFYGNGKFNHFPIRQHRWTYVVQTCIPKSRSDLLDGNAGLKDWFEIPGSHQWEVREKIQRKDPDTFHIPVDELYPNLNTNIKTNTKTIAA